MKSCKIQGGGPEVAGIKAKVLIAKIQANLCFAWAAPFYSLAVFV